MAGREPDIGPTARTVADNVKRLRTAQNLNFTELSERLIAGANWSINAVGIRRIESGERRVTPDDLLALAVALKVSPPTLLMPETSAADEDVIATGIKSVSEANQLWEWLTAAKPDPGASVSQARFAGRAWPRWFHKRVQEDGLSSTLKETQREALLVLLRGLQEEADTDGDD